ARVASEAAREDGPRHAHTGRNGASGSVLQKVWVHVIAGGVGAWMAQSAGEGQRRRWATASRVSGRHTPGQRARVGRQRGLVPWQCPRRGWCKGDIIAGFGGE